jgi:hypothetical protein
MNWVARPQRRVIDLYKSLRVNLPGRSEEDAFGDVTEVL